MTPIFKNGVPKAKKGKGRGRGGGSLEEDLPLAPKTGKGRAATQGVVIAIANSAREEALAEQALKRKRLDGDEPMDDTDEQILQGLLTKETVETALTTIKKKKAEGKTKREHHACDRCFRNKTKVIPLESFVISVSSSNRRQTTKQTFPLRLLHFNQWNMHDGRSRSNETRRDPSR